MARTDDGSVARALATDVEPAGRSRSAVAMDTLVTVCARSARPAVEVEVALGRALDWFGRVERTCSRFDPASELVRLCERPGEDVPVGDILFQALAFAAAVARLTRGAFDPTVGGAQRARGFDA